jgi:hypothetical protein
VNPTVQLMIVTPSGMGGAKRLLRITFPEAPASPEAVLDAVVERLSDLQPKLQGVIGR